MWSCIWISENMPAITVLSNTAELLLYCMENFSLISIYCFSFIICSNMDEAIFMDDFQAFLSLATTLDKNMVISKSNQAKFNQNRKLRLLLSDNFWLLLPKLSISISISMNFNFRPKLKLRNIVFGKLLNLKFFHD